MCGISGFWRNSADQNIDWLKKTATNMANTLVHRGPDDSGTWVDQEVGLALSHRRLSIMDVSDNGHQPMISADGRFVITYNGEVYNFQELRQQLEKKGHFFKGHSDTEVMLAAFVQWGVEESVKQFNGMFAFAVWDRRDRLLWLTRDRIGEKPLFFGVQDGTFFFSSELKAIRAHPEFKPEIDHNVLASFLRFSYVPAPHSIYRGIKKLLPGHLLCLKSPTIKSSPQSYWSLKEVTLDGMQKPFDGSDEEAVDELEKLLKDTVRSRMISDVPLGAFLSGGIDSSTIVALMQAQSNRPVNTFTIGFHEQGFNEAVYAKKVAQHLGTNHTELYVTPQEAMNVIPKLPAMYDEPFADSSQIPTHLISVLAREYVTVSLSGDGGDELFGGYNRYFMADRYWGLLRKIPYFLRQWTARGISSIPVRFSNKIYSRIESFLPHIIKQSRPTEKLYKLGQILSHSSLQATYRRLVSVIYEPDNFIIKGGSPEILIDNVDIWHTFNENVTTMQYLDLMTYHPDDILVKVDRAAMEVSLETRLPYLDHEIVEFATSLPLSMRFRKGQGKWLLRQVLYRHVPENLIERPKMGFGVPIGDWIKGSMREWVEELVDKKKIEEEGYFNSQEVNKMWQQHLSGKFNRTHELWNILMFQAWLGKWK